MGTLDYLLAEKPAHRWLNHRNLYLLGLAVIICGLGWSNLLMSVGQFILIGNWIIEFNFKEKLAWLKENKVFWILISLFILHLIGLAWTENLDYGFKDLRIKLPLIALPVVIVCSRKLENSEWKFILGVYFLSLVSLSIASATKLTGLTAENIIDKRELSINISHIRYGLNLAFASTLCYFFRRLYTKKEKIAIIALGFWFVSCLFLFQLYTGIICLFAISLFKLIHFAIFKSNIKLKILSLILISAGFIFIYKLVIGVKKDYYKKVELTYNQNDLSYQETINGENYWMDKNDLRAENGVYIRRFIAWEELEREWGKRSKIKIDSQDLKGQFMGHTITRYLSSKGLKKDSVGLSKISDKEVKAIERGVANVYYLNHTPVENRIHRTFYEIENYRKTGIANGFSMAMRLEFWETAAKIIEKNPIIGVGTGDIKDAFQEQYIKDNSLLEEQYRRRSHNQYITFFATFGVAGLLVFTFFLFAPLSYLVNYRSAYWCFWMIAVLSFLAEDTLETQAGVTFFAFFNSLFLLNQKPKKKQIDSA